MREIKFRAWYPLFKRMINVEDYPYEKWGWFFNDNSLKHVQYTGLKDKNGREIYEGDILNCVDFKLRVSYICRVAWNERGYWYTYNTEGKYIGFLSGAELPEIIGNIYENPELLEGDKS